MPNGESANDSLMSRALDEVTFDMPNHRVRSDSEGHGHFAAKRGSRIHFGIDYLFNVGEAVPSPVAGRVHRIGYCYDDDHSYRLIEILTQNKKAIVRLLYVAPAVRAGDFVIEGDIVGQAQDIAARYNPKMKNHVHCEVFVDPAILKGGRFEEIPDVGGDSGPGRSV